MKVNTRLAAIVFGLMTSFAVSAANAQDLPNVRMIATGGTIAGAQASAGEYGYKSGTYDVDTLISAVRR